MAEMIFNSASGRLKGRIGQISIDCRASAGRQRDPEPDVDATDEPAYDNLGPLPPGLYEMTMLDGRRNIVKLTPNPHNQMHGRSGFLIHGHGDFGPRGSIVAGDAINLDTLCTAIRQFRSIRPAVLQVIADAI